MNDFQQISTQRLSLRAVRARDASHIYWLNSDPRVWAHRPSGAHTSSEQTRAQVAGYIAAWERDGLGCWTARTHDGTFVGIGGCSVKEGIGWNVLCRFLPEVQGRGYEAELVRAAVIAASVVRPELPIVFLILEDNESSKAAARNAGLAEVWRGPDEDSEDDEDPGVVRLVYADRELPADVIDVLQAHSKPRRPDPAQQDTRADPGPGRPSRHRSRRYGKNRRHRRTRCLIRHRRPVRGHHRPTRSLSWRCRTRRGRGRHRRSRTPARHRRTSRSGRAGGGCDGRGHGTSEPPRCPHRVRRSARRGYPGGW